MQEALQWILKNPKVAERLSQRPGDQEKIEHYFKEIHANFSWGMIRKFKLFLEKFMMPLYDEISLQVPAGIDLQKMADENCLIFVPNHQSHADYLAISYKLAGSDYRIPLHITAGVNLNIFPIGPMFRNSGAFFIRRTLGSDVLYKLTLESYVQYLISLGTPIEFFFEGGRSRTGKLLPPKFGMFNMILAGHQSLPVEKRKPMYFVPVSIVHELLPEEKGHARELEGGKKKKEKTTELFKLFKVLDQRFGSIHINVGQPILVPDEIKDLKESVQDLAFGISREVGKGLLVTPTAVLAMVMLDDLRGAMTLEDIMVKAHKILRYCDRFGIPVTKSLSGEKRDRSLNRAFEILMSNKKVDVIPNERLEKTFYAISEENRVHLLYGKNTILHHFLTPFFINSAWIKVFNGQAKTEADLKRLFLSLRLRLKHEFYLPTVKELLTLALEIVSHYTGRPIQNIGDCLHLNREEMFKLIAEINVFGRGCLYIFEAYYIAALTLKHLYKIHGEDGFKKEQYLNASKEIFSLEKTHGRMIRFAESYSVPLVETAFKHFEQKGLVKLRVEQAKGGGSLYVISDIKALDELIQEHLQDLTERLSYNLNLTEGNGS